MSPAVRRGLPRTPGGEPWPPARPGDDAPVASAVDAPEPVVEPAEAPPTAAAVAAAAPSGTVPLRRGLPREPTGEPWPPAGMAPARIVAAAVEEEAPAPDAAPEPAPEAVPTPASSSEPVPTPRRMGRGGRAAIAVAALLAVVALVILVARWLVGLDAVASFMENYPGTYALPEGAPVGIPAWVSWTHFFNMFLIALILRTGLAVRYQTRPEAYWARRSDPKDRIGLLAWTHQALDVLWVANGAAYIVLLLSTGQWVRIVPTSWSVIPNAVSTVLQYASLNWPAEHGWVYYNALQQLMYFLTVFVAAPLAVITGVRMSIYWRGGGRLDRIYPKNVARAVHFPVMIYFVAFVVGHVALVLTTGARENLDAMFAGRDSATWLGVALFLLSLAVTAAAMAALRPLLLAPVAGRFGDVTSR
ncbi:cytochrome b/b6 domain-containing protein [Demequina soli]|uniref:cytochrome b/b6 domain-containing protein n=1 Tax=Demequina soli TaxID=1638987 RepID=UPI0007853E41|nr:cytochrome b/b6 domain-containing protein [Demequina soli]